MAFNAKNLTYENNEPAFLRKLKSQYGGSDGRSDRPTAFPRKKRLDAFGEDGDEDGPTVLVDETTNEELSKEEYEKLMGRSVEDETQQKGSKEGVAASEVPDGKDGGDKDAASTSVAENVAGIGAGSKRRVGKVVGNDEPEEVVDETKVKRPASEDKKAKGRRGKKIKLSFDEEDTGD